MTDQANESADGKAKMSTQALEAIKLYKEALSAKSEEVAEEKALAFARLISMIVEPNKDDPNAERRRSISAGKEMRSKIFNEANRIIEVGDGTGGCKIRFSKTHPENEKPGEWMYYSKPLGENWEYGGVYWQNFMKHFKKEVVNLQSSKVSKKSKAYDQAIVV